MKEAISPTCPWSLVIQSERIEALPSVYLESRSEIFGIMRRPHSKHDYDLTAARISGNYQQNQFLGFYGVTQPPQGALLYESSPNYLVLAAWFPLFPREVLDLYRGNNWQNFLANAAGVHVFDARKIAHAA